MKVFQIGSSLIDEESASDFDLLIVCDKPVDLCFYTTEQWEEFKEQGHSEHGQRIVVYPRKRKGDKVGNIKELMKGNRDE